MSDGRCPYDGQTLTEDAEESRPVWWCDRGHVFEDVSDVQEPER